MAEAASIEKIWQKYQDQPFITLGIDVWNGQPAQVRNYFRERAKTTYPLLLNGSAVARTYKMYFEDYIVVDHEGIIRYRPQSFGSSLTQAWSAIDTALTQIPQRVPPPSDRADGAISWGAIKTEIRAKAPAF